VDHAAFDELLPVGLAASGVASSTDDATLRSAILAELARSGTDTWLLNVVVGCGRRRSGGRRA
jgi:hypothetical protein